jgi:beta-glucosidase
MFNLSRFFLMCAFLLAAGLVGFAEDEGKIIAVYGDAASVKDPPPGWRFLWNANGKEGDSKGYVPLSCDGKSKSYGEKIYGVMDDAGALRADMPNNTIALDVYSINDSAGVPRFYIASYTMQEDSAGEIWINNGNLRNFADTTIKIYVNDEIKFSTQIKKYRFAQVFQKNLGKLKKGDSICVAVGPGEESKKGGGRFHFTIEDYPAGHEPGKPANIITPPIITEATPQLGADGRIGKAYLNQHNAQCAEMLSKKPELVFIGDSITARWPPELLEEKFGKYRPVKLGVAGDWIQNVLWRVQNGVLDQVKPKVIVLLIGTNNISGKFTPDEITEGVGAILKALHEKTPGSKILLHGIFPRGEGAKDPKDETVRQTNAKIALLADNKTVFYLDIRDALLEPDGTMSSEVMPDKLHPAKPGFDRWIKLLEPEISKLLKTDPE